MTVPIKFDLVADLYDAYVTTSLDIQFYLNETAGFDGEILELMCGTGRVSIPLLESGKKLCCVDYSNGMLDSFKKKIIDKSYSVQLVQMDVTKLALNKEFGLIILPFHSFSEIVTTDLQIQALKAISTHLKSNGVFICSLQNPKLKLKTADGLTKQLGEFNFGENKKLIIYYSNRYDPISKIVSGFQKYEIYDDSNNLIEKRNLDINFRPISDSKFRSMIKPLDFEIVDIFGDYQKSGFDEETSNFLIYKLKKSTKGKRLSPSRRINNQQDNSAPRPKSPNRQRPC